MAVRDGEACLRVAGNGYRVLGSVHRDLAVRYSIFYYCVRDLLAVFVYWQIRPGHCQSITGRILRNGLVLSGYGRTVGLQYELHIGAFAVLVRGVVPYLRHRDLRRLRLVAVRDRIGRAAARHCFRVFIRCLYLIYAIRDVGIPPLRRQMRPLVFAFRVRPYSVRPCTQRHRLAVGRLRAAADLLIQLHLDARRTLAILVAPINPNLRYFDLGLLVLVGIINIVLGVRRIDRTRCD